jgi:dUTP pyrophosphatase
MAAKFEKVSKYKDIDIAMPERKTSGAAGYDMVAAEDVIIPPYEEHMKNLFDTETGINNGYILIPKTLKQMDALTETIKALDEMSALTKSTKAKPTLVSTGMKCRLDKGTYLELAIRSSSPLKYWLILANGVGIIDEDYYNNPDNEGEIFFQIINLSPFPIKIQKGEIIGQGIIMPYLLTEDDAAAGIRTGGLGSTTK